MMLAKLGHCGCSALYIVHIVSSYSEAISFCLIRRKKYGEKILIVQMLESRSGNSQQFFLWQCFLISWENFVEVWFHLTHKYEFQKFWKK